MTVALLRKNLIALETTQNLVDLVPSWNLTRFYKRGSFLGKVLTWLSFGRDLASARQRTLNRIQGVFFAELSRLENHAKTYFSTEDKAIAEKEILLFCMHLKPLIKNVIKDRLSFSTKWLFEGKEGDYKELFSAFRTVQKIKDLEIVTGIKIPSQELLQVARNEIIKENEARHVIEWIQKVKGARGLTVPSFRGAQSSNSYLSGRFLHRVLRELLDGFSQEKKADLGRLESYLFDKGLISLKDPDPKHIKWRSRLKPGDRLQIDGSDYVIGEILKAPSEFEDSVVFAVENEPGLEVEIHCNEAIKYLDYFRERTFHCGIPKKTLIKREKLGTVILQERLYNPFNEIQWRSTTELTKEDEDQALPIKELIQGLRDHPFTPCPLTVSNFAFNLEGQIRAINTMEPYKKSADAIKKFAWDCARGNPLIHAHLIQ